MRDIKIKRRNFEVRRGERQAGFSKEKYKTPYALRGTLRSPTYEDLLMLLV